MSRFDIEGKRNGLRSAGDRIKYMSGCRCTPCRAANSNYETERAAARRRGEWNGYVPANKARHHLILLSRRGIGRDTVSDLTGLGVTMIDQIRMGSQKNLRAMNEKKILAVDLDLVANDAQLISAVKTWERIRWMLREGFTKTEIARRLGYKTHALQLNKKQITARNAQKVEQLYNRLRAGDPDLEEKDTFERFVGCDQDNA
jgi:hypothetical protein